MIIDIAVTPYSSLSTQVDWREKLETLRTAETVGMIALDDLIQI